MTFLSATNVIFDIKTWISLKRVDLGVGYVAESVPKI